MKKAIKATAIAIVGFGACVIALACQTNKEAEQKIAEADTTIEIASKCKRNYTENETVSLSYSEWKEQQKPDINAMDVWTLGSYLYGISELDTTRTLKIITYESYEYSPLSYYVACCCWVRATENLWGYENLYRSFGEADESYDSWMDEIEIADWAYDVLRQCYCNPTYARYCNGMMTPDEWIYEEKGIYVW